MRLFVVGAVLVLATPLAAQSRWTVSGGPEWTSNYSSDDLHFGGRVRAEYDLTRSDKALRLRLELGGFWQPSYNYFGTLIDGTAVWGGAQTADLTFGITAALAPFPKARFSPYATIGILAQQYWSHGWFEWESPQGQGSYQRFSQSEGTMIGPLGIGMRARLGNRMFQVEFRQLAHRHALLFGTSLPF
jgi:hypothetical protein